VKAQPDGSAFATFRVPVTDEFISFVLRWGDKVEVTRAGEPAQKVAGVGQKCSVCIKLCE
jgi:predicted DNA-binding transcriptional regulator YafY